MLSSTKPPGKVARLEPEDRRLIEAFMLGAAYSYTKHTARADFTVQDIMGGSNYDWRGTPLDVLYQRHIDAGSTHAQAELKAGQFLGHITKAAFTKGSGKLLFVIHKVPGKRGPTNSYRFIGKKKP